VIAVVRRQTGHLARLIDDLLDVSRLTSGKVRLHREPVELHALARRCLDALAQSGRGAHHEVLLEGGVAWVLGDPARLEQVVTNLVDNALKYTPAGGRVVVRVAGAEQEAVLHVIDTGKGIAADLLPQVFDLFVQEPQALDRARGGLGLGLAVVKRLVELHGGSVSVHSAGRDRGSAFVVRLQATAPPEAGAAAPAPGATPGRPRRVLVVEDNDDARDMLAMLLEVTGHVPETATDGPSGLVKLREFRPDIALIDVGLPGMDGYTVARTARAQPDTRDIRLVALTGYGQAEDRARALAAGFDVHVTKPVDPAALQELIARL
jgi:CheY-like chemotaxis protein